MIKFFTEILGLCPKSSVKNLIIRSLVHIFIRFSVDFGENLKVRPTHYTLRYSSSGDYCCPRSWLLQGTNNVSAIHTPIKDPTTDSNWTTLRVRMLDHYMMLMDKILMTIHWMVNLRATHGKLRKIMGSLGYFE